jgi:MFS family permease
MTSAETIPQRELDRDLRLIILDGLATEAMTTLTGGAFLVAFALLLGATNFQIGLLASLPTFTNLFQILSIWLVRRYGSRRQVSVICSLLARTPLLIIGSIPFLFPASDGIRTVIAFLFCFYFFGSIAGPSWNAWMKDLIPEKMLGSYFSRRSRYSQLLNVGLSLLLALSLEYARRYHPGTELKAYAGMFLLAGLAGIMGALVLGKVTEPVSEVSRGSIFGLMWRAVQDANFRRLLVFNSAWVFALNIATPFFNVFLMKSLGLTIAYIIPLTILNQLSSILTIRFWGIFADRYSNKTILAICTPLYLACLIAWCFVGIYTTQVSNLILLVLIHLASGASTSGVNLAMTNIGLKLAPRNEAIVYLSTKSIFTSLFSALAPLIGGYLADFFTHRHFRIIAEFAGPHLHKTFRLLILHEWNFLFLIGAFLAVGAIQLLAQIKETGEVGRGIVVRIMRSSIRNNLKESFVVGGLAAWPAHIFRRIRRRRRSNNPPGKPSFS